MNQDFKDKKGAPGKSEEGVEPIITQIDILRNPVFSITDFGKELDEAQSHNVGGLPQIEIKNRQLSAAAADVFHILIHLGKKQGFELDTDNVFYFTSRQILELMSWDQNGRNYKRFDKCLEELTDVRIKFAQPLGGQIMSGYLQFFHSKILFHPNGSENPDQSILFKSQISFTPFLLNLCKKGRLKPIHPVYYELRARLSKRLLELLSAYASDLPQWEVDVMWLRDIIPMTGKKYIHASNVKDNLNRALNDLLSRNIILFFEFQKKDRKWFVVVRPNREFLYSKAFPVKRKKKPRIIEAKTEISDSAKANPLYKELIERKVTEETAATLLESFSEEAITYQIDHYDYLWSQAEKGIISREKAPQTGGWFITALKGAYKAPKGFKSRSDQKNDQLKNTLFKEAQYLIEQGKYSEAISKAEERLEIGDSAGVRALKNDAEKKLEEEKECREVEKYIESRSSEQLESLHKATEERLKILPPSLSANALRDRMDNPSYKSFFLMVAKERYQEEKDQMHLFD